VGIPRGWDFALVTNGAIATIIVPAAPGISHVLTGVFAELLNTSTTVAALLGVGPQTTLQATQYLNAAAASASAGNGEAAWSWTGELAFPVGAALIYGFSGTAAGLTEVLEIQGYDQ
jgi:hypothetical protein